jgi:hypothetical protein
VLAAQARQATRGLWVEVPAKFFWDFAAGSVEAMRELASEARKQNDTGRVHAIERAIDEACEQLDKLQRRAAS